MKLVTCAVIVVLLLCVSCGNQSPQINITPTPAAACTSSKTPELAYVLVNPFTSAQGGSINSYTVDSCTGALAPTTPASVATGVSPENIAVDPSGRFAYAANLVSNATDLSTISMFTIDSTSGALSTTSPAIVGTGFFPQGIAIDPSGRFVYTANSDDNTVSMFTVDASTGILTPTSPPAVAAGSSPLAVTVHPSGKFAYVVNQDDGTISMYNVNLNTGVLTPITPATVRAGYPADSPFEIRFDTSGKFAYVPDAYSAQNTVIEYSVDQNTGVLTQTGVAYAGNSPTSVAVNPSGKFAYVANRMDNTLSMYSINSATGALTQLTPNTITTGVEPFRVKVDPSGKFVYVANEIGSVSIYTMNNDGTLTAAGEISTGAGALDIVVIPPPQ